MQAQSLLMYSFTGVMFLRRYAVIKRFTNHNLELNKTDLGIFFHTDLQHCVPDNCQSCSNCLQLDRHYREVWIGFSYWLQAHYMCFLTFHSFAGNLYQTKERFGLLRCCTKRSIIFGVDKYCSGCSDRQTGVKLIGSQDIIIMLSLSFPSKS